VPAYAGFFMFTLMYFQALYRAEGNRLAVTFFKLPLAISPLLAKNR